MSDLYSHVKTSTDTQTDEGEIEKWATTPAFTGSYSQSTSTGPI